ncbi:MAG: InlB B-repeat-containing protein [Acholeplasmatales bacterium]|jgi:uncharacterized repeat protein (TIGR02543 family)|nr:InlB B-repeat-containing protein [Acholeplasmatales bacterium]
MKRKIVFITLVIFLLLLAGFISLLLINPNIKDKTKLKVNYYLPSLEVITRTYQTNAENLTYEIPGVTHLGWYIDTNANKAYDSNDIQMDFTKIYLGELSLVSKYNATLYNVIYDLDYGYDLGNPTKVNTLDSFELLNPIKHGYQFLGWYNSENQRVSRINKGTLSDINLKASWASLDSDGFYFYNDFTVNHYLIDSAGNITIYIQTVERERIGFDSNPHYLYFSDYVVDESLTTGIDIITAEVINVVNVYYKVR